jgi:Atypical Arm repeat
VTIISEAGGVKAIEKLQTHGNMGIYQRSVKLLETYFGGEEEEEGELGKEKEKERDSAINPEAVSGGDGNQ